MISKVRDVYTWQASDNVIDVVQWRQFCVMETFLKMFSSSDIRNYSTYQPFYNNMFALNILMCVSDV